jgi:hypothetical protein
MGSDRHAYRTWHYVATIGFTAVCAWFVFGVGQRPPGLTFMDIAVHETGHWLFRPFGELVMLIMGNGTQILFPLTLAVVMLAWRRDLLAGAVFLAWAGEACGDTANYIADAPYGRLPLLGAPEGDWTRILGPDHLHRLQFTEDYARDVRVIAVVLMLAAVGVCAYAVWRLHHGTRPRPEPQGTYEPVTPQQMWR